MSFRIRKREDDRYIILTPKADKVIDDAFGYGYRTRETAYAGFTHYWVKSWQKHHRELKKHEREKASRNTCIERPL